MFAHITTTNTPRQPKTKNTHAGRLMHASEIKNRVLKNVYSISYRIGLYVYRVSNYTVHHRHPHPRSHPREKVIRHPFFLSFSQGARIARGGACMEWNIAPENVEEKKKRTRGYIYIYIR